MEEPKEEVDDGIKVINTLSELIYPQAHHETKQPEIVNANSVTEALTEAEITENLVDGNEDQGEHDNESYIDSIDENIDDELDFSGPIDITTDHDHEDEEYHEAFEENEIPDETDETEFIQHETEPLLQDIANQMMHYIEESTTAKEMENIETTTVQDQDESEGQSNSTDDEINQANNEQNEVTQTEAAEVVPATELIDVRVSETSEAENLEKLPMDENKNEDLQELLTTVADDVVTPTEKPVETESSSTAPQEEMNSEMKIEGLSDASSLVSEFTPVTESLIDTTTEAIMEHTSRTTVMEPNAEITSTIANFIHDRNDEATTVSTFSNEVTTKDTRRKCCTTSFKFLHFKLFVFFCFREN